MTANSIPDSWDETDTTKSAGTNDLVGMKTGIVDGAVLGSNFIIYSSDSIFLMEFVGGNFIFNFRKLFTDEGLISQNCVVEVEGKHYCFGPADIYVHDGTTKQSIRAERSRMICFHHSSGRSTPLSTATRSWKPRWSGQGFVAINHHNSKMKLTCDVSVANSRTGSSSTTLKTG